MAVQKKSMTKKIRHNSNRASLWVCNYEEDYSYWKHAVRTNWKLCAKQIQAENIGHLSHVSPSDVCFSHWIKALVLRTYRGLWKMGFRRNKSVWTWNFCQQKCFYEHLSWQNKDDIRVHGENWSKKKGDNVVFITKVLSSSSSWQIC